MDSWSSSSTDPEIETPQSEKMTSDLDAESKNIFISDDWKELHDYSDPQVHQILKECQLNQLPQPKVGFEIQNQKSEVIGECELAWAHLKVGVSLDPNHPQMMDNEGWEIFTPSSFAQNKNIFLARFK